MKNSESHLGRFAAVLLVWSFVGTACTVTQMQKDNEATAKRIEGKEAMLTDEEAVLRAQRVEQVQLLKDLNGREMNAEELYRRIEKMRQANANMIASNQQLMGRKVQIERELAAASRELQGMSQPATARPDPAAARKLEETKRKLRKALELLAAS